MKNVNLIEVAKEHPGMIVSISVGDLVNANKELIDITMRDTEKLLSESNQEIYLSADKVAQMLGVDRSTLWRWEKSEYLVPIHFGGKVRYKMSDIKNITNQQKSEEQ